jgi:type II secretory pathway pseudopilin PulG
MPAWTKGKSCEQAMYKHRAVSRALTLLEVLVVIASLAILVALTLPTLRGLRQRGDLVGQLSALRQHGAVMKKYSSDFQDTGPTLNARIGGDETRWTHPGFPELAQSTFSWRRCGRCFYFRGTTTIDRIIRAFKLIGISGGRRFPLSTSAHQSGLIRSIGGRRRGRGRDSGGRRERAR